MAELIGQRPEQSGKRVEKLKLRKKRCRCKYCGGSLKLRRIIFSDYEEARVELYCNHCERIEYGVEREVYQSAEAFVDNSGINLFPGLDDNKQRRHMNIAKVAEIVDWGLQNLGLEDDATGFTVPLNLRAEFMSGCTTFDDAELDDFDDEIEDLRAFD